MRKYLKNKKMAILSISLLTTTLILTGTFAWSVRLFSTTGGLGEDYHYIVKLLDIDTDPLFVINKWEDEKLNKKVYATSSYNVADIKKQYNDIIAKDSNAVFRDTWVRIKLEETFMRNGSTKTDIVTELNEGKLISSFDTYFSLDSNDVDMITLDTWIENQETPDYDIHGRFWILDTESGWLYWAQPLLATTELGDSDSEIEDQTTDHIIDEVSLVNQPAGVWEYTIKATLEAIDVELQGYNEEGAWSDIDESHPIYELFAIEEPLGENPLPRPTATITSDTLSWNSIDNAIKYEIYVDGILVDETTETSYNLSSYVEIATSKQVRVKAIADGTTYTDSAMSTIINLDTPLPITATYFPDETFRTWLTSNIAAASDGLLTANELKFITSLDISNNGITDVTGLEYFTSLVTLDVSKNHLIYLDVTSLTKLNKTNEASFKYYPQYRIGGTVQYDLVQTNDSENIKEWYAPQFDESGNLYIDAHNFPDDAFRNYLLTDILSSNDDYLKEYIVNGKSSSTDLLKVKKMNLSTYQQISNLDGVEHFSKITHFTLSTNPNLKTINLSGNADLTHLFADNMTNLTSLNLSSNTKLLYLFVNNNPKLASIDVSKNLALSHLYAHNLLSLTSLDVSKNQSLYGLYAYENPKLTSINLGTKPTLVFLHVYSSQLSSLNISGCTTINKIDGLGFKYNPQKNAVGGNKTLKTAVTASTTLLEWQ